MREWLTRADQQWPLTGRIEELDLLRGSVSAGPVVVGGGAGVGKTRLTSEWAREIEGPVVSVTATATAASIPFGAFARWVPPELASGGDRLTILLAVCDAIERSARTVVVDDAHLLDEASAAVALALAEEHRVALIATVRTGEALPDAISALWREGLGTRLDLLPLSQIEVDRLVVGRLGSRVDPLVRRRAWDLSSGNPMFVRELVDGAVADGALRLVEGTWRWDDDARPPRRLVEVVEHRLASVDPADRRLLELLARGEPLQVALLASLDDGDRLDGLARAGLVAPTAGDPEAIVLAHPLYGEVLRATTPRLTDRRNCAALIRAASEHPEGAGIDPVRVGLWAVEGQVAEVDAEVLLDAAVRAVALRDDGLGLRLAEAAEGAGAGSRARLLEARCLAELGRDAEHAEVLAGLDHDPDPAVRSESASMRAFHELWAGNGLTAGRRVLVEALATTEPPHDAMLASSAATFALYDLDLAASIDLATSLRDSAETPDARLHGIVLAAAAAALDGQPEPAEQLVAERFGEVLAVAPTDPVPPAWTAISLCWSRLWTGRVDEAHAFFTAILDGLALTEQRAFRALPLLVVGRLEVDQGKVALGAEKIADAVDLLGDDSRYWFGRPTMALAELSAALGQLGDADGARKALADARSRDHVDSPYLRHHLLRAEAWTAAARGESSRARSLARDVVALGREHEATMIELVGLTDATRLGDPEAAAPRLEELRDERPLLVSVAAWSRFARGLANGDGEELDAASVDLEQAGYRLAAAEASFQAIRNHGRLGLRRREAAAADRSATLGDWCGVTATPLLTSGEVRSLGADLTAREREIAHLVVAGRTNREIASTLGVSVRTVNSHLNHAYTKLGTSERGDLARLLGRANGDGAPA